MTSLLSYVLRVRLGLPGHHPARGLPRIRRVSAGRRDREARGRLSLNPIKHVDPVGTDHPSGDDADFVGRQVLLRLGQASANQPVGVQEPARGHAADRRGGPCDQHRARRVVRAALASVRRARGRSALPRSAGSSLTVPALLLPGQPRAGVLQLGADPAAGRFARRAVLPAGPPARRVPLDRAVRFHASHRHHVARPGRVQRVSER